MAKDERVELLRTVHLFAGCTDKQLAFIATQVEDVDVPAGKVLCTEGASGGDFFVVVSGTAKVERGGTTLNQLGPGAFFGEIALMTRACERNRDRDVADAVDQCSSSAVPRCPETRSPDGRSCCTPYQAAPCRGPPPAD